uniref:Uncharacterized protein n=1 Tax=Haemonchus contortus TaxID=6289 RepID=A0A7I4XT48_HAECO
MMNKSGKCAGNAKLLMVVMKTRRSCDAASTWAQYQEIDPGSG